MQSVKIITISTCNLIRNMLYLQYDCQYSAQGAKTSLDER